MTKTPDSAAAQTALERQCIPTHVRILATSLHPQTSVNTSQIRETEAESATRFVQVEYKDSSGGVHGCYGQVFAFSPTKKRAQNRPIPTLASK
jgi:hypothetical protein